MARKNRVKTKNDAYYHVMSRIAHQAYLDGNVDVESRNRSSYLRDGNLHLQGRRRGQDGDLYVDV